ncbi:hypothetical protein [Bowmanella sp. JS7-9]|uniref:Lipoprotein n=1 Tax=Pseudobowmanella zhangzhouensis TaxID=1537679 RepID=A0ABW1XJE0_9ALTE|nr:hypothetical protein [Bowmanella sp. JS7-9]TBX27410.1 hypothetical protein TK45_01300 [Bowmanella sp. JS7-9]
MKKLLCTLGVIGAVLSAVGCNSTNTTQDGFAQSSLNNEKRSMEWCQENYSSASVSTKQRQNNARFCDSGARAAYNEAREKAEAPEKTDSVQ